MPHLAFTDDRHEFALESDAPIEPSAAMHLLAQLAKWAEGVRTLTLVPGADLGVSILTVVYADGRAAEVVYLPRRDARQSQISLRLRPHWRVDQIQRLLDALLLLVPSQIAFRITAIDYTHLGGDDAPAPDPQPSA